MIDRPGTRQAAPPRMPPRENASRGYIFVALAACLWGTLGLFFRGLHDQFGLSPLSIAFLRASTATIILLIFALATRRDALRISLRDIPFFMLYGLCGVAAFYFFYIQAVIQTNVTTAVVLLYTAPTFVSLMAWKFWNEAISRRKLGAIVLAFVGCALIARAYDVGGLQLNAIGLALGLGAGFTYALYTIFSKFALARHSSLNALFFALLFGSLFLTPLQSGENFAAHLDQPVVWILVLGLAVGPTLGSLALYNAGLARVPASNASLVATIEPVIAAVLAFIALGERLENAQLIGGVMVVGAAAWLNWGE
jgi:drug/metabolite transporter, DME family